MITQLREPFDMLRRSVGQWWFSAQTPIDWGPAFATVTESDDDSGDSLPVGEAHDDDDNEDPLPADAGSGRPKCTRCGDPNFSLEKDVCIGCRALLSPSPKRDVDY